MDVRRKTRVEFEESGDGSRIPVLTVEVDEWRVECWFSIEEVSPGGIVIMHRHLVFFSSTRAGGPTGSFSSEPGLVELRCRLLASGSGKPDDAKAVLWDEVITPHVLLNPPWAIFVPKSVERWKETVRDRNTRIVKHVMET